MLAGIRDILIILHHTTLKLQALLGDGSGLWCTLRVCEQLRRRSCKAFTIGKDFIGDDSACLVLGDNIFHGAGFYQDAQGGCSYRRRGDRRQLSFGYWVNDPERYGVAEFDKDGNCLEH